jgi:hypothetical protein
MRLLFRSLAFLDLISLVFMGMQLWGIAIHYNKMPNQLSVKIESLLMFPMFLLVLVGAYGLFFTKKFGFILYYIQFPFRLYLWVFTVGFITFLPEALDNFEDKWPNILLKVCIMTEFIRLYLTIKGQLKLKDQQ